MNYYNEFDLAAAAQIQALMDAGNAIVPQVAAEILRCMMRVDSLHNK